MHDVSAGRAVKAGVQLSKLHRFLTCVSPTCKIFYRRTANTSIDLSAILTVGASGTLAHSHLFIPTFAGSTQLAHHTFCAQGDLLAAKATQVLTHSASSRASWSWAKGVEVAVWKPTENVSAYMIVSHHTPFAGPYAAWTADFLLVSSSVIQLRCTWRLASRLEECSCEDTRPP